MSWVLMGEVVGEVVLVVDAVGCDVSWVVVGNADEEVVVIGELDAVVGVVFDLVT